MLELLALAAISLPAWGVLLRSKLRSGSFVEYSPRWPAPWGAVGAFMALGLLALSVVDDAASGSIPADQAATQSQPISAETFVQLAVFSSALNLFFVALMAAFLYRVRGGTLSDLGLPTDLRTLLHDIGLGAVIAAAALLPVYGLQAVLVYWVGLESEHPTLVQLFSDPNPMVLAAAWLSAGLAAPVFEEFIFRLLFQGWLERVEDEALGVAGKLEMNDAGDDSADHDAAGQDPPGEYETDPDNPFSSSQVQTLRRLRLRRGTPPSPPEETLVGLPHGLAPVLVSSFVFALLHLSQGAAVGPLFVFALMLGYVYQRTHRITPSIVAHMAFNTFSLVAAFMGARAG